MWFKPKDVLKLPSPMGSVSSALNSVYETPKIVSIEKNKRIVPNIEFYIWDMSLNS
jgi:hypothetical protein